MKSHVMLDLQATAARIGLAERTLRGWRWRAKSGLPLDPAALALTRIIRQVGGRLRVSEIDLDRWLREKTGGIRNLAPQSTEAGICDRARELAETARACGLDCCADALALAGRLAEGVQHD